MRDCQASAAYLVMKVAGSRSLSYHDVSQMTANWSEYKTIKIKIDLFKFLVFQKALDVEKKL